ncbi:putative toxin-antitoxin system toxin component, PIN family [Treponema sp.]|uniref:putative toxin-antitoxin system toxin component, PIN family n=1 Tax=Treponema sp. TaxID=166 RepID=UPI0025DA59D5|nr:putative toxin-antitoxin system toxin component, PIN family [Treponema sp.]MBR4322884.1 putative toxin-antitoxin system toxin component, PIN family [Treponema sp.]
MKIVIDTNVVVSALFFGGKPEKLLQYAAQENVNAVVSKEIIDEYNELSLRMTNKYPEKQKRFLLDDFISMCSVVQPSRKITVCRDPDDNKFLECATEAKCLYVVSGDNDLLDLKQFEDVEIITVAEFFERLGK